MGILDTIKKRVKDSSAKVTDDKKQDKVKKRESSKLAVKKEKNEEIKKISKSEKGTASKTAIKKDKKTVKKEIKGNAYRILIRPLITEKVTELGVYNKYAFEISLKANKTEVKKSIKEVYGVMPISVNIINMKGKKVRSGRTAGKKKDWKKAIVTLKTGEKIQVYEGV